MGGSVLVEFLNSSRNSKLSKILKFRKRYHEENGTNRWKIRYVLLEPGCAAKQNGDQTLSQALTDCIALGNINK